MKKHSIFFILVVFSLFFSGCKYDFILPEEVPPIDTTKPISFSKQIVPVFTEKCISCHDKQTPKLTSAVVYTQIFPNYVNTASPENSKIYSLPVSGKHYAKFSDSEAALVLAWIKQGASNN